MLPKKIVPSTIKGVPLPRLPGAPPKAAPPTVNSAPPTVNSAPPTVNSAPPTVNSAHPTVNSAHPTVNAAPPTIKEEQHRSVIDQNMKKKISLTNNCYEG